jgi:hypothetical protein
MRHYKLFLAAILFLGAIGPALVPTLAQTLTPTPTALPAEILAAPEGERSRSGYRRDESLLWLQLRM